MADCSNKALDIGSRVAVFWVGGCGDDDPTSDATVPLVFKPLGYTNTKSINKTFNSVDAVNDSSGAFDEKLVTGVSMEIPVSVMSAKDVADICTQEELSELLLSKTMAGEQPYIWLKFVDLPKGKMRYFFVLPSSDNSSFEPKGVNSGEYSFTVTSTGVTANPAYQTEAIV